VSSLPRHAILPGWMAWSLAIVSSRIEILFDAAGRVARSWRDRRLLHALDDRMLKDMGISRSDIERVAHARHPRPARDAD